MKRNWNKLLAALLALVLALATMALAEETLPDAGEVTPIDIAAADYEPEVSEVGEAAPEDFGDAPAVDETPAEATPEQPLGDWTGTQTWWFLVGDTVVYAQEAQAGEAIPQPEDPAAPEGQVFDGWYLEDGTRLFDGEAPVAANPDPQTPDVNVFARFVEAAPAEEPQEPVDQPEAGTDEVLEEPVEEPIVDSLPAEIIVEEPIVDDLPVEETVEEPAVEEPQKPSPSGAAEGLAERSGGAAAPDEVSDAPAEDIPELPTANTLTYTGEAQTLVTGEGWLYSLDGENYDPDIPAAVNAGEYTVYFIPADATETEPQALTVTVAKADVVFTPPVAAVGEA